MPEKGKRLIDAIPAPAVRPRQMKLLGLGMPRTGTFSTMTALQSLGWNPYHMVATLSEKPGVYELWAEALRAKYYGEGEPYGKEEFDKLLGNYDAVLDIPCLLFYEELLTFYPDAKILITTRDEDSWVKSFRKLIETFQSWNWELAGTYDKHPGPHWHRMMTIIWGIMTKGRGEVGLRETFKEHYANLDARFPKDKALRWHPRDGWAPLCKHIGAEEVPQTPFPNTNDIDSLLKLLRGLFWVTMAKSALRLASMTVVPAAAVAVGAWYLKRSSTL